LTIYIFFFGFRLAFCYILPRLLNMKQIITIKTFKIISITLLGLITFAQSQNLPERLGLLKPDVDDDSKYTTTGNIGITITNFGTFGDGFRTQFPTDQPSCVYPKGSGIEHLFVGGLWVGANTATGIHVTTGAFNTPRLSGGGSANFEFTNTSSETDRVIERSSIPDNKYYSGQAISHQDFVANFTDTNRYVPQTGTEIVGHTPIGLGVHLETYAWNYPFADAFVIFNYTIKNVWQDTLRDVYIGLWADLVVRNTNITPPRVGSPFYLHAASGYVDDDAIQMVYCYDYDGDPGFTDSYVGIAFLGAEPVRGDTTFRGEAFHNWWLFSGGDAEEDRAPSDEASRYERMRKSIPENYYQSSIFQKPGNRMCLISTGPFDRIPPDSTLNVVFAVVCAKKAGFNPSTIDNEAARKNLVENTLWAYRAYHGEDSDNDGELDPGEDITGNGKLDRYLLPTPPTPPIVKVIPENQKVTLLWDDTAERSIDLISKHPDFEGYRIYRSSLGDDSTGSGIISNMTLISEYDAVDGLFYDTGFDKILLTAPITTDVEVSPGVFQTVTFKYKYEIEPLHNGWQYAFSVTAFDSGDAKLNLQSLESSRLQNLTIVSPGTPAPAPGAKEAVGVYPNPYRAQALWDGKFERERKLYFYNLPEDCEVRIYTLAGDLVDKFTHKGSTYNGNDIKWYQNYSLGNTIFPGGEHAWDLVSRNDQAIATGLYIYTVQDKKTDKIQQGKLLIIK